MRPSSIFAVAVAALASQSSITTALPVTPQKGQGTHLGGRSTTVSIEARDAMAKLESSSGHHLEARGEVLQYINAATNCGIIAHHVWQNLDEVSLHLSTCVTRESFSH